MNPLHIGAVVFSFASLLLLLICLGSDYWVTSENRHAGLWNICVDNSCVSFGMNVTVADHIVRAFLILGMIAGAVSCFVLCATFFKTHVASISLAKISCKASIFAGLCAVIAMATFTQTSVGLRISYSCSFVLGWTCFPFFLITGTLAYFLQADLQE